jgi:hypothetical protein
VPTNGGGARGKTKAQNLRENLRKKNLANSAKSWREKWPSNCVKTWPKIE